MKVSLYGQVHLLKEWCLICKQEAFLISGELQCCGRKKSIEKVYEVKRESLAEKFIVSPKVRKKAWDLQKGRCFICGIDLSELWYYRRGRRFKRIIANYDHFIPKSFEATNNIGNIYLMCNLCNQIKSNKMYENLEELKRYVIKRREKKGTMQLFYGEDKEILPVL